MASKVLVKSCEPNLSHARYGSLLLEKENLQQSISRIVRNYSRRLWEKPCPNSTKGTINILIGTLQRCIHFNHLDWLYPSYVHKYNLSNQFTTSVWPSIYRWKVVLILKDVPCKYHLEKNSCQKWTINLGYLTQMINWHVPCN